MNPDDVLKDTITFGGMDGPIGTISVTSSGDYGIMTSNGIVPMTSSSASTITTSTVTMGRSFDLEDFLDSHIMNRITLDHKVQEQELMKLRETVPTYADEIKENLSKNAARDIIKKMTFTKKHDKDADVHHFLGRVWVFTEDELKNLINEVRNA